MKVPVTKPGDPTDPTPEKTVTEEAVSYVARNTSRRWQQIIVASLIAVAVASVILNRAHPVIVERIDILPLTVMAGEDARVSLTLVVKRQCPGTLSRMLVSKAPGQPIQLYDPVPVTYAEGQEVERLLHIPYGFSIGPAIYKSSLALVCDPLQTIFPIHIVAPDVPLIIEAPPERKSRNDYFQNQLQNQDASGPRAR